ncbi:uncharacterized protein BO66DRAFT_381194 [Aspergillus aculeatinus CBS 121060]|uniref:Uncharacterized protein n=1 Tax=Aspergillus aculeatinus CBS 121060 TaxID=1448322 RepID=A0ACD1GZE2_9EURO|nr:hypothetical protein BO66DRAFT_381194 [Aspergillus aculeatinus CBS 121060]RAH66642.1 hypothetical protein BO66DRAFT_381194 [Aspergillus aculeatinus CBS 121060]
MEDTTSTTIRPSAATTNPPSVENAYKRKCLALKKRLNEIEEENEQMRVRNRRGWQYIQKMRLESCILLERLAKVTGMTEEASSQAGAAANPELRARAVALMSNASALNGLTASSEGKNGTAGGGGGGAYLDDETEGSSDEQPPTPQERPLRVKRSRKSNLPDGVGADDEGSTAAAGAASNNAADNGDNNTDNNGTLPRLAPAPSQDDLSSTFRLGAGQHPESDERGTSQNPESGSRTQENENEAGDASVEPSSTPMDVDVKEPKEES